MVVAGTCGPETASAQPTAPPTVSGRPATSPPAPTPGAGAAPPAAALRATPPASRPRVAIADFAFEGEGQSPGLAMQLRDGLLIGLVREGIDVVDSTDVAKQTQRAPELQGCETSPCLKRLGELIGARYVLRAKISLAGNSYRMSVRMFSTEGPAPAALPVAVLFRPCDVCTVNEAREQMIRLAEGVRARLDQQVVPAPPPPAPAPPPRSRTPGLITLAAGLAAVLGGAVLINSSPDVGKRRPAVGGAFMGLGLAAAVIGIQAALVRSPGPLLARPTTPP
jgi:TolB-like protein